MALPDHDDGGGPRYFGVYPAIVTNIVDGDHLGRIELRFPTLGVDGDKEIRAWATLCSPYADEDQGLEILPEVGSQVVVGFEAGDLRRPYMLGAAWHGAARQPRRPDAANNLRVLRSREQSEIEFDDTRGAGKLSITTKSGNGHRVVLDNGTQSITIHHATGSEITLDAVGQIHIHANVKVDVTAPLVNVTAPMSTFTGVVKCQTLIADAFVISPAYTPGVGNIL
jgi:uncharacterized protein involved in type VI secretion and phage assembly